MTNLSQLLTELKEKAAKATPKKTYCPSCGSEKPPIWQERSPEGRSKCSDCKKELRFVSVPAIIPNLSPGTIATLCEALEEAREVADSCDKIFSVVERVGRETFCHADFAPEHKKARAFLAKYFPKGE